MRQEDEGDIGLAMDAAMYFVMSHYHIGPSELSKLSPAGFGQLFSWATATEQVKAEKMEEQMGDAPNAGGKERHKIKSTSMNKMPFSE
jgi:hypothetical protein